MTDENESSEDQKSEESAKDSDAKEESDESNQDEEQSENLSINENSENSDYSEQTEKQSEEAESESVEKENKDDSEEVTEDQTPENELKTNEATYTDEAVRNNNVSTLRANSINTLASGSPLNSSRDINEAGVVPPATVRGKDHFDKYGDVIFYPPNDLLAEEVANFNYNVGPTKKRGALQLKEKISFENDFDFNIKIANSHIGNQYSGDGWGFIFTKSDAQDYMQNGGILRNKGMKDAAGFKVDTAYHFDDPMDQKAEQQKGGRYQGYGTFVKNGPDGTTEAVGTNVPDKKNKDNKFDYADDTNDNNDGKFHGQTLNDFHLSYDSDSEILTAEYAGKQWKATLSQLGLNKEDEYNFLITSSQSGNNPAVPSSARGWMRTDLNGSTFKFTPKSNAADEHNPGYNPTKTKPGKQVSVNQTGDQNIPQGSKFEIPQTPQGWNANIDQNNGTITVTPPSNTKPGTKQDIPVKVTYPDGTVDNTNAQIEVVSDQAGDYEPGYNPSTTNPGKPVEVDQTGAPNLPQGTEFEVPKQGIPEGWEATVGEDGKLVVTPSKDIEPGTTEDIPVKVKYPDGSTDDAPAKVTVKDTEANQYDPGYEDKTTNPGKPVELPQTGEVPDGTHFEKPSDIPEGWDVDVDPNDGTTTVTPPADAQPGDEANIPVKVTYPDGSSEDAPAKVTVKDTEANQHDPGYEDTTTNPGKPVEVDQTGAPNLPQGTEFEVPKQGIPEGWEATVGEDGKLVVTPSKDIEPGTTEDIPVKVKYPDGSTDDAPAKVTVKDTEANQYDPGYEDKTTNPGKPVELPQTGEVPDGTHFEKPSDIPEGWDVDVDPNDGTTTVTPPADAQPGDEANIPVKVKYPDGQVKTHQRKLLSKIQRQINMNQVMKMKQQTLVNQ